ncbi:MAG: hypothetical protein F6K48_03030 [Okeania sp. SIO3H1]|nr:hypothetical protein [Okeania sp. SIO3H1]
MAGSFVDDTFVRIFTKVFAVTQNPATGNLWASIAEQLDAWLQEGDNTNILIRDIDVMRPNSTRSGVESVVLTIVYEAGWFFFEDDDVGISAPWGFGKQYRVLFLDSLIDTPYETFNDWYEDQDIVNGLDDDRRMEWIISMPAFRRGDIEKGSQFFALYAETVIEPSGSNFERASHRQLQVGRGDYLSPLIVEAIDPIIRSFFGNMRVIANDGSVVDPQGRGKIEFSGVNMRAGERAYATNDQWRPAAMSIITQGEDCP